MKLKLFKQDGKLPLYTDAEKSSCFQKIFQAIEAALEKIVEDKPNGRSGSDFIFLIKVLVLVPIILLLFIAFLTMGTSVDVKKGDPATSEFKDRQFGLFIVIFGVMLSSFELQPYERTRHLADLFVYPIIASAFAALFCAASLLQTGIEGIDVIPLIGIITGFFASLFLSLISAQRSSRLRFDPTKDNHLFIKTISTSRDTGVLRIVESNVFRITLQNVGTKAVDISEFKICRLSIDFTLPKYSIQPGQQIELIPEVTPFEGKCVRVPGIHCFGLTDRACTVTTVIFCSESLDKNGCGRCDLEHAHKDTVAELTVRYRNELKWAHEIEY